MEILKQNRRKFHASEAGIVLLLFSRQIANVARFAIMRDIPWITEILFLLSFALMFDWRQIRSLRFEGWNLTFSLYFLYVIYVGIIGTPNLFRFSGVSNYVYVLFILPIIFALASNKKIDVAVFVRFGVYAASFLSLALLVVITDGFTQLKNINMIYDENGVAIADRATLSQIGIFGVALFLSFRPRTKADVALLCVSVPALAIDLVLLNRRSAFLVIAAYFLLLAVYEFKNIRFRLRYLWIGCGILAAVAVFVLCSDAFRELLLHSIRTMFNAVMTFLGIDAGDKDPASLERIMAQREAFAAIFSFDLKEVLFGIGIGSQIDYPLLQSMRDGGIVGFALFCYFGVFLPIRYLGSHRERGSMRFFCFLLIMNFLSILYTGTPYNYIFHLPVILASYVFEKQRPLRLGLYYEKDPLY